MDFAYDEIAVRTYSTDRSTTPKPGESSASDSETTSTTPTTTTPGNPQRQNLQTEFQESFKAFSNSPWGTKLGGWWSTARTQGASYYETARKEAEKREAEAARALEEARKVVVERTKIVVEAAENQLDNIVNEDKKAEIEAARRQKEAEQQEQKKAILRDEGATDGPTAGEEDTATFLNRFKSEAAKRLKEVQRVEDAADEALLRFGTNIRNFLQDTISVTGPDPASSSQNSSEVLFESRDATTGKRVIHTSRFDAQLHVVHSTPSTFTQNPDTDNGEWETFKSSCDIDKKTDSIAADLEKYPELRSAMEKLVPEQVEYKDFWTRYYFLRHVVDLQEEKRKELLKASAADQEEVGWDEDSDSDIDSRDKSKTSPTTTTSRTETTLTKSTAMQEPQTTSTTTTTTTDTTTDTTPQHARTDSDAATLKAPRRSHDERSVADSEASYDLVSGAASHATSSPKQKPIKEEESDDDWE